MSGSRQKSLLTQCTEFIDSHYGTAENRKEGYPYIMGNFVVSCKSGNCHGIAELRDHIFDVASQVKANTGECVDQLSCDYNNYCMTKCVIM